MTTPGKEYMHTPLAPSLQVHTLRRVPAGNAALVSAHLTVAPPLPHQLTQEDVTAAHDVWSILLQSKSVTGASGPQSAPLLPQNTPSLQYVVPQHSLPLAQS
jgi:hypothetical protein